MKHFDVELDVELDDELDVELDVCVTNILLT